MNPTLIVECAALGLLFVCSVFFASVETTFFSLNPMQISRLSERHPRAARRIRSIMAAPTHFLSTVLIGNTLVTIAASSIGYIIAEQFFPSRGEAIAIPAMTIIILVCCEVAPKRHAMRHAETLARGYSAILPPLIAVFTPARLVVEATTSLFTKDLHAAKRALTEDEFLTVVEVGEEEGVLAREERTMVDGIVSLERMPASSVMTPRVDLIGIDLDGPSESRERIARSVQFRYLPVYRKSIDHPEGFLDVPRFLLSPNRDFEPALVSPCFVPATASLASLLSVFQNEHRHAALVMDEYGGTAGMVTMGDILEEIVGGVEKEYEHEKLTIQKMGESQWIVDGSTSLEDINYELGVNLSAEGVDRISGWVSVQTSRIPRTGDVVEAQGCRVTVHRTKKNRVLTVFVEKLPPAPDETWEMGNDIV